MLGCQTKAPAFGTGAKNEYITTANNGTNSKLKAPTVMILATMWGAGRGFSSFVDKLRSLTDNGTLQCETTQHGKNQNHRDGGTERPVTRFKKLLGNQVAK